MVIFGTSRNSRPAARSSNRNAHKKLRLTFPRKSLIRGRADLAPMRKSLTGRIALDETGRVALDMSLRQ